MKTSYKKILIGISIITTLTAFMLSLFIFLKEGNRANATTFSNIGESNRVWFFFYCLSFVLSFSFNIIMFTLKYCRKHRNVSLVIYALLGLTIIFSFLQSIIIDFAFHVIHILLAVIWTGFGCLTLITAIAAKLIFTKSRHGYYYLAMMLLTGGINFYAIYAYGWLIASYQWLFAATLLITSFALAHINNEI